MSEYKRLTAKKEDRYWEQEEFWQSAEEPSYEEIEELYSRLAELEDKIESGRLVELPKPFIEQQKEEPYAWQVFHAKVDIYAAAGKDIFPKENKESAEARLKELQEGKK